VAHRAGSQQTQQGRQTLSRRDRRQAPVGQALLLAAKVRALMEGRANVAFEDLNALALPALPARERVTLINTVPSAMAELVRQGAVPAGVLTVNLAGEPLPPSLLVGAAAVVLGMIALGRRDPSPPTHGDKPS